MAIFFFHNLSAASPVTGPFAASMITLQFKWPESEINEKLEQKMVNAFNEVYAVKENKKIPMRIASFMVAIDRVSTAYALREG